MGDRFRPVQGTAGEKATDLACHPIGVPRPTRPVGPRHVPVGERAVSSARHSASAFSRAASSTRIPWRSYRRLDLLKRTTIADRPPARLARRVSAASPDAKKTRPSRSAQVRHKGPSTSMNNREPLCRWRSQHRRPHTRFLSPELQQRLSSSFVAGTDVWSRTQTSGRSQVRTACISL